MATTQDGAAKVARALSAWWLSTALGEKSAARIHRDTFVAQVQRLTGASVEAIDGSHGDELVTGCWHEFLRAQSTADRTRISEAASQRILLQLGSVGEEQKGDDPQREQALHATDSFYYAGTPIHGGVLLFGVVAAFGMLKACVG